MSDMGFEAPDADAEEQHQEAVPAEADEATGESGESGQIPLETNDADRAEQWRSVSADDEYR